MSLIDDALKRAQEATRKAGEAEKPRPWTPAPLPDAGLARRRRLTRIAGWTLGALAAAAVLGVALRAVWNAAGPSRDAVQTVTPVASTVVPQPSPTIGETVVIVPTPLSAVPAAPAMPRPTRRPTAAEAGAEPSAESSPAPSAPPPPQLRPTSEGRRYVGAVDLQGGGRIELGGIVWSEDQPRALLNDRIVGADAYVEGWTLVRIEVDRVVLEKDGAKIVLTLR